MDSLRLEQIARALGVRDPDSAFRHLARAPERTLKGYGTEALLRVEDGIVLSVTRYAAGTGEKEPPVFALGPSGGTLLKFRATPWEGVPAFSFPTNEVLAKPWCAPDAVSSPAVPVQCVASGAAAPIDSGDDFVARTTFVAESVDGREKPEGEPVAFLPAGPNGRVSIRGVVKSFRKIPAGRLAEERTALTLRTAYGHLEAVTTRHMDKELLRPGTWLRVTGWLVANLASGEYERGAVFDMDHALKVLRSGALRRDPRLIRAVLSPDASLDVRLPPSLLPAERKPGELSCSGSDAVPGAFLESLGKATGLTFGRYTEVRGEVLETDPLYGDCHPLPDPWRKPLPPDPALIAPLQNDEFAAVRVDRMKDGLASAIRIFKVYEKAYFDLFHEFDRLRFRIRETPKEGDPDATFGVGWEPGPRSHNEGMGDELEGFWGKDWTKDIWPWFSRAFEEASARGETDELPDGEIFHRTSFQPDYRGLPMRFIWQTAPDEKGERWAQLCLGLPVLPGTPVGASVVSLFPWDCGYAGEVTLGTGTMRLTAVLEDYPFESPELTPGDSSLLELFATVIDAAKPEETEGGAKPGLVFRPQDKETYYYWEGTVDYVHHESFAGKPVTRLELRIPDGSKDGIPLSAYAPEAVLGDWKPEDGEAMRLVIRLGARVAKEEPRRLN